MINIDEIFKLLNIYFEIASIVKKDVFAIDLNDTKIINRANDEKCTYKVNFDNEDERLIEIQFNFLYKFFDDNSIFVFFKDIYCITFCSTNSFQ